MNVITPCTIAPPDPALQSGMPSRRMPGPQPSARICGPPGNRFCKGPGRPGIIERETAGVQPVTAAPGTQGAAGVTGTVGDKGAWGGAEAPATFGPVAPASQPGGRTPETPGVQGAARTAGAAESNISARTLPPKANLAAERGNLNVRSMAGMRRVLCGTGAGFALMLPGTVGAAAAATSPVFWRLLIAAACAQKLKVSLTIGGYIARIADARSIGCRYGPRQRGFPKEHANRWG